MSCCAGVIKHVATGIAPCAHVRRHGAGCGGQRSSERGHAAIATECRLPRQQQNLCAAACGHNCPRITTAAAAALLATLA
jgi:hypothetical protein